MDDASLEVRASGLRSGLRASGSYCCWPLSRPLLCGVDTMRGSEPPGGGGELSSRLFGISSGVGRSRSLLRCEGRPLPSRSGIDSSPSLAVLGLGLAWVLDGRPRSPRDGAKLLELPPNSSSGDSSRLTRHVVSWLGHLRELSRATSDFSIFRLSRATSVMLPDQVPSPPIAFRLASICVLLVSRARPCLEVSSGDPPAPSTVESLCGLRPRAIGLGSASTTLEFLFNGAAGCVETRSRLRP